MKIENQLTDDQVLLELGARFSRHRLSLNLTQADLARRAGVGLRTVQRLEAGSVGTQLSGFLRVCRTLDLLNRIEALIPESTPSPIEQLRQHGRQRRRASGKPLHVAEDPAKWTWGDAP